jgi:hypothetical protein
MSTVQKQDLLLCDYHGTFIFSWGGTVKTDEWSFSAINIQKAILKLRIENAPYNPVGSSGFAIDYYDYGKLEWKTLGEISRWYTFDHWSAYKEIDVTEICEANPKFKWRMTVWGPFMLYYSCAHYVAVLYVEWTGATPEAPGTTSTTPFGNEAFAPIGQMMEFMIQFMMLSMFMSLMISMVEMVG